MKIAVKVNTYKVVYESLPNNMAFGCKNLILGNLAFQLGLRHFFNEGNFELLPKRGSKPLLIVKQ